MLGFEQRLPLSATTEVACEALDAPVPAGYSTGDSTGFTGS